MNRVKIKNCLIVHIVKISIWLFLLSSNLGMVFAQDSVVTVLPGQGVSFSQVDFTWQGAQTLNSNTGQIDVTIDSLKAATDLDSGFINASSSEGWIIQNLPVFAEYPYSNISTNFDLGVTPGTDVDSILVVVEFSIKTITSFEEEPDTIFPVGDVQYNASGVEDTVEQGTPTPPPPDTITFYDCDSMEAIFQPNHPNIETADDQCLPAAVATSLQWLENTYDSITVPHPNIPGLGEDGSLVGALETYMGRTFRNRRDGDPTSIEDGLTGKLSYLANNGLSDLEVKHQGSMGNTDIESDGVTSKGQGETVTFEFIMDELKDGEDVELGFLYPNGGGHAVEVVGAGIMCGAPFIMYQSDHDQENDAAGTGQIDFSFLLDSDGDGRLNLVNEKGVPNMAVVFTQSPSDTSSAGEIPSTIYNFELEQNYPNPFNFTTTIRFNVPSNKRSPVVNLNVYDNLGRHVKTLKNEPLLPGSYSVQWNGTDNNDEILSSGIYLYQLKIGNLITKRRMIFIR